MTRTTLLIAMLVLLFGPLRAQSIPNYKVPLFVTHLSGKQKYMLMKAGAPKHNALTRVICFKHPCRGVIGWTRTQQRNKFKGYKKPGIPRLQYLKADSLKRATPPTLPTPRDTTTTIASKQIEISNPVRKDSAIAFVFDHVLFDTNSSTLKNGFMKRLDSLSDYIKTYPSCRIRVVGHTDTSGRETANAALSQNRADAVAFYLSSTGIDRDSIITEGRGGSEPIADNSTSEGRQRNRRVEVFLTFD